MENQKIIIDCSFCSKKIEVIPYEVNRLKHHFCSKECYYKGRSRFYSGINHPRFKTERPKCIDCGKEIWRSSKNKIRKRCRECWYKFNQGKNHPNYIDGMSSNPYVVGWNNELREVIRKRDNYICQNCGMTEEEHLIVCGSELSVHHIDYDKDNYNQNNLIALCTHCHMRTNFNRDYWIIEFQDKINLINKENIKCKMIEN